MSKRSRRRDPDAENTVAEFPSREEIADLQILCEDAPLIAVSKPAGLLSQGAPRGVFCLPDYVKAYLKYQYDKPGNVYLGVIHRIDRPVTGVVLFSRNSKGAARLSEQFRERQVKKTYLALLESPPPEEEGKLVDLIRKIPDQARAVIEPTESNGAKRAELSYRVLGTHQKYTLVEVTPLTGRMHQIRLQFASRGCPIVGDQLYGATREIDLRPLTSDYTTQIALHAWKLEFQHPVRYDTQVITAPLPSEWPGFAREFLN
ncbi:RluA family pseudouridine synthase [Rubinisphaera italica]|uniref:Ribosomal large subunit pseudouridine synthase C n=1 Tax=Rubinisphaera italica TaxID=2527969 RepID=A0A5C5XNI2_9PLAN|nr:RNA pseudouridine synthase [Rubinisphaera italica]TWT64454.1 Ribosomal large subunit pseudouridine synthase C [Rubinisphaera italica]